MTDRAMRGVLVGAGVLLGLYGAWLLLSRQGFDANLSVLKWAVGGVIVNDALIAALALLGGLVVSRALPRTARAAVAVGAVVLAVVTVVAVPVLGRFGATDDNPTLLDRDYTTGYLVVVGVVVLAVVAGVGARMVTSRRAAERATADEETD